MAERTRGRPGRVYHCKHGSIACEYPSCGIKEYAEQMVRIGSDEWYCPAHGLLLAAKELVSLYGAKGEADWTAISKIICETLPDRVEKFERMVLWGAGWVLTHEMVRRLCREVNG